MLQKRQVQLGLFFLVVIALLTIAIVYILSTADSDSVKSARQNSHGTLVESDDVVVERAGNWTTQDSASASGGNYLYSSGSPDDILTLTFVGSRVEVIYTSGANLGTLAVDVDRSVLRTVMTAEQSTKYQESTVVDYLDDGVHILRLYAQEGGVIGIDAFRVSRATQEVMIVDMGKLPNGALAAVQTQGRIQVHVDLQDPEPTIYRTPGQERNLELIDDVQNRVLSSIKSGSLEVIFKPESAPGFIASVDLAALLELQANPLVISITLPDEEIPLLDSSAAIIHADIVRNQYGITGRRMVVAVIDSGVDVTHPDLSDDIMLQYCANVSAQNPVDRCPASGDQAVDTIGHGTIVTGVITSNGGITNNGHSLIGIAPDAKIVAVRTRSNTGTATSADLVSALDWIYNTGYQFGISSINISLGYGNPITGNNCDSNPAVPGQIRTLISNIHDIRGIKIFAASGNDGNSNAIVYPACLSGVIAIGATNDNDTIRPLSNGSPALDFLAPGGDITSTGATTTSTGTNVCLNTISVGVCNDSGTSFASPHAASVGLLIEQTNSTAVLSDTPPNNTSPFRDVLDTGAVPVTDTRVSTNPPSYLRIDALGPVQNVLPDGAPGAPANNLYTSAYPLPVIASIAAEDYEYIQDANESTKSGEDIPLPTWCGGSNYTNTVWYRYSDSSSYTLSLSTVYSVYDTDPNNLYDTILAVYRNTITSNTLVTCNDDINLTNRQSAVNFQVDAGATYYIMVARKGLTSFAAPAGLHLLVSRADAGDTLVTFHYGSTSPEVRVVSSLRSTSKPVDTSRYPSGSINGRGVMGDWDGDGKKTPGFYASNGVFYTTNIIGTVNGMGGATWNSTWFGLMDPTKPTFAVAGRFDPSRNNDCIGVIEGAQYQYYGLAFALYFTCDFSVPNPPKTYQWLSVLLPDSQGFVGTFQFAAGEFGSEGNIQPTFVADGIDTIAVRRGESVAFSNTPPLTLSAAFPYAQYLNFGNRNPDFPTYGSFLAGDWDTNGLDSFGIYFNIIGVFWRRNNLAWDNHQNITQGVGSISSTTTYGAASWREPTPIWP